MDPFEPQDQPRPDPIRPEDPHWSLAFLYLAFRPRVFFDTYALHHIPALVALAAWSLGMFGVIDRYETKMVTGSDSDFVRMLRDHWGVFWGFVAVVGVFSGALYFAIGGWWYRVRLKWAGAVDPDTPLARRVYLFASQVVVLPTLLITAWDTFRYDTPREAYAADKWTDLVPIVLVFWSVYVSYRGVRTAFETSKWKARLWFFILPFALYGTAFAVIIGVALMGGLTQNPDIESPIALDREAYRLEYPGNWSIDKSAADYDPDAMFTIEPLFSDAALNFWFYLEPSPSQDCVDATLETMEASYELESVVGIDSWGANSGAGYRGIAVIEGGRYEMILFCSTDHDTPFEVMMLCEADAYEKIRSGFEHIERTFEVKSEPSTQSSLLFPLATSKFPMLRTTL